MNQPDKTLTAVCGLFCPSCTVYIGTHEDPARLQVLAERMNTCAEELACDGCRAEKRCLFCTTKCTMAKCAADKGLDFCGECLDYPCEGLKAFQTAMPHRNELWKSHERIKEVGWQQWHTEMIDHYSCPDCRTINSAYDFACRKCGASPSSPYSAEHKQEIIEFLTKNR